MLRRTYAHESRRAGSTKSRPMAPSRRGTAARSPRASALSRQADRVAPAPPKATRPNCAGRTCLHGHEADRLDHVGVRDLEHFFAVSSRLSPSGSATCCVASAERSTSSAAPSRKRSCCALRARAARRCWSARAAPRVGRRARGTAFGDRCAGSRSGRATRRAAAALIRPMLSEAIGMPHSRSNERVSCAPPSRTTEMSALVPSCRGRPLSVPPSAHRSGDHAGRRPRVERSRPRPLA